MIGMMGSTYKAERLSRGRRSLGGLLLLAAVIALVGCTGAAREGQAATNVTSDDRLLVVTTTNVLGDVVAQVAGGRAEVESLMPVDADPHAYQPTPQDLTRVADADLVFMNGLDLEANLEPLVRGAATSPVIEVSEGVATRAIEDESGHEEATAEAAQETTAETHDHGDTDPHVWLNPLNVLVWTENIEAALAARDPDHADAYAANGEAYREELRALDAWIREQVAVIPPESRLLVADHDAFGYFADRYGFELLGTVIPGLSTLAEPSAQETAQLSEAMKESGAKAIFVGSTVSPTLADRLAGDVGVRVVRLYVGSLSASSGPAAGYLELMRYNTEAVVKALTDEDS